MAKTYNNETEDFHKRVDEAMGTKKGSGYAPMKNAGRKENDYSSDSEVKSKVPTKTKIRYSSITIDRESCFKRDR